MSNPRSLDPECTISTNSTAGASHGDTSTIILNNNNNSNNYSGIYLVFCFRKSESTLLSRTVTRAPLYRQRQGTAHVTQEGGELKRSPDKVCLGRSVANPNISNQISIFDITGAFGMAPGKVCSLLPAHLDSMSSNCLLPLGWP